MTERNEEIPGQQQVEKSLSDALASLSMSAELDSALLAHLNLLDKYMFHTECLSQHFRMAFFDLARANRDKSASGGSRIGETGYDQRMQASRRIYTDPESDEVFMLKNFSNLEENSTDNDEAKLVDPLRWYGVLAPQTLKDAQSRFVNVLEEGIEVANAMVKLRTSEAIVVELRKKINSHNKNKGSTSPPTTANGAPENTQGTDEHSQSKDQDSEEKELDTQVDHAESE